MQIKLITMFGLLVAAAQAGAQQQPENLPPADEIEAVVSQKAYIDPDTGQLITAPASIDPASPESNNFGQVGENPDLPPVEIITHADGTVQVDLKGRFRTPLMATIGCDGVVSTEHSAQSLPENPDCEDGDD